MKEFGKSVESFSITFLDQIADETITRNLSRDLKKAILLSKNSGKKANRLAFDLTTLRAAVNHVKSRACFKAGFTPVENPVPATKKDQKPDANPEKKTMPFTAEELTKLRECASLKYVQDSQGRRCT